MTDQIVVKNLYKIFGPQPDAARRLIDEGAGQGRDFRTDQFLSGARDASFRTRDDRVFVIMGLSSSGKLTLVRMLNGLIEPTAGEI